MANHAPERAGLTRTEYEWFFREWFRKDDRADHHRQPMAQKLRTGYDEHGNYHGWGDRPWQTHEPQVRMDIMTAVQIASLSDQPLGLVELLTDTAPATPVPHEMPCMASVGVDNTISGTVDMGRRYRDRLNTRIRQAREAIRLDGDIARSSAFVARVLRDEKIARGIMWACGGVAGALLVTLVVWLVS